MFNKKISEKHPDKSGLCERSELASFASRHNICMDESRYAFKKRKGLPANGYFESYSSAKLWYGKRILPLGDSIPPVYIVKEAKAPNSKIGEPRHQYLIGVFLAPSIGAHIPRSNINPPIKLIDVFKSIEARSNTIEGGLIPIKPLEPTMQSNPAAYFATGYTLGSLSKRTFKSIMGFDY